MDERPQQVVQRGWLRRFRRWLSVPKALVLGIVGALLIAGLPVPWLHVVDDDPPGWAWRLDGRMVVDGEVMDPAGRWSWLTVGRPPLLYETVRDAVTGTEDRARDMRVGTPGSRPAQSEPLAAAIGLRAAGLEVPLGVFVEVAEPRYDWLPETAVITHVNGIGFASRAELELALDLAVEGEERSMTFTTAAGDSYNAPGAELPYDHVRILDLAPQGLDAGIGGRWSQIAPVAWFRSLSLGSSHGMMVALLTYAHVAEPDLAAGRHIAGTGGVQWDGTVSSIGGLPAKAAAARRAGADVLLFPAAQADELTDFDPRGMELVPVGSLAEAIRYLSEDEVLADDPEDAPAAVG